MLWRANVIIYKALHWIIRRVQLSVTERQVASTLNQYGQYWGQSFLTCLYLSTHLFPYLSLYLCIHLRIYVSITIYLTMHQTTIFRKASQREHLFQCTILFFLLVLRIYEVKQSDTKGCIDHYTLYNAPINNCLEVITKRTKLSPAYDSFLPVGAKNKPGQKKRIRLQKSKEKRTPRTHTGKEYIDMFLQRLCHGSKKNDKVRTGRRKDLD